jgi:ABC-type spermidine/putrescine transport system permease subunit II
MEGIVYIACGTLLLIIFPLRYIYVHYIKKESHVMVITHHYRSHWLLELMRKAAFGIAFFGSFIISIGAIMYGLKLLVG